MAKSAARPQLTRLSTKGQLIIPKEIRTRHGWAPGTELILEDHGDSVVLHKAEDFPETSLEDLIGCAGYTGPTRSVEEMEAGIARRRIQRTR